MTMIPIKSRKRTKNNVLNHNITSKYCFNARKEFANMTRRSLFKAFGQDKENNHVTTYKQNEPSIILLVDSLRLD